MLSVYIKEKICEILFLSVEKRSLNLVTSFIFIMELLFLIIGQVDIDSTKSLKSNK